MSRNKSTHHPSAPKAVRLPTHGKVREVNSASALELMVVGGKKHGSASLSCYGFSSCLCRAGGGLSQFWPNFLPVIRAQLLAPDFSIGCAFDLNATLQWHALLTGNPVRNYGRGNAQGLRDGERSPALPIYPVFEVHTQIISHGVSICQ